MKKILQLSVLLGLSIGLSAQKIQINTPSVDIKSGKYTMKSILLKENESHAPLNEDLSFLQSIPKLSEKHFRGSRDGEEVIGTTTWDDLPSSQRLFCGSGGTLSAVWTGSLWDLGSAASPNAFPDRGTFYNYFDGNSWGDFPTKRIENVYCGYPANVILKSKGEILFSHVNSDTVLGTSRRLMTTDTFKFDGANRKLDVLWPRATAWGDTVHVIGSRNKAPGNNYIHYFRSTDGGQSWDGLDPTLPKIDTADCIKYLTPDSYAIDARGSTVAIVGGGSNNTMYLWKSFDNGETWQAITIWNFSVCGMDGRTLVSSQIETSDGSYAIILDNNNMAHIFCGYTHVSDDDTTQDSWTFRPGDNALLYWNESFGEDSLMVVGYSPDRDGDEELNIGQDIPNYSNTSLASMPTASMDTTANIIYCVYAVALENTDLFNDYRGQSYRDLFGIYSTDNGKTWSNQVDLTNTADMQMENVYPSASKYTRNGKVDVIWMRDMEPGTAIDDHQQVQDGVHTNDIVFKSFSLDDFNYNAIRSVNERKQEIEVFPNPSDGMINLHLPQYSGEQVNIIVTNILGETIKSFSKIIAKSDFQLNLDGVGAGMYFLRVESKGYSSSGRIIIE